jgi:hypothetical protein
MGHTTFHSGEILFNAQPVHRLPVYQRARRGIGFVPQERLIFPSLSVHENLTVAARPGRWSVERVYELFPRLKERRAAMGNQLSGGEQQMLAIGRALMGNPRSSSSTSREASPDHRRNASGFSQNSFRRLARIILRAARQGGASVTDTALVLNRGASPTTARAPSSSKIRKLTSLIVAQ